MTAGTRLHDAPSPMTNQPPVARGWLLGPWLDALLVANVAWPLVLLVQFGEGFSGQASLQFWQLYFITTPHRWITLALVYLDRERLGERRASFLAVAGAVVAVCLGVRIGTGTLTCLLAIDYIWNAWHFAAQHHGIYRIYGRLSEPARTQGLLVEKWSLRLFLLYVILRVAGATWSYPELETRLMTIDWFVVVVPLGLVIADLARTHRGSLGRSLYLISVCAMFLIMLWAVHTSRPRLVLSLATASALFHAIEYLTLVGWSGARRHGTLGDRMGLLGYLAPRWAIALTIFLVILGSSGWLLDQHLLQPWLFLNVIVAFLHYAYDGMIWRGGPTGGSAHVKA